MLSLVNRNSLLRYIIVGRISVGHYWLNSCFMSCISCSGDLAAIDYNRETAIEPPAIYYFNLYLINLCVNPVAPDVLSGTQQIPYISSKVRYTPHKIHYPFF